MISKRDNFVDKHRPSEQMKNFDILTYGEFDMLTLQRYESKLSTAGFNNVSTDDRNYWYRDEAQKELELIVDLKEDIVNAVGEENYQNNWESFWQALVEVLKSNELIPVHFRAMKKNN